MNMFAPPIINQFNNDANTKYIDTKAKIVMQIVKTNQQTNKIIEIICLAVSR